MPDRILSSGPAAAALACLVLFAGSGAAEAARCPLGEIYRPSRGVCVSKQQAIQAGVYRGASQPRIELASASAPKIDETPTPKPRPQALMEIERRAPLSVVKADPALAFVTNRKAAGPITTTASAAPSADPRAASQPSPAATPASLAKPEASPFGSLVALEPAP